MRLDREEVTLVACKSDLLVNGKTAELRVLGTDWDEVTDVLVSDDIHMVVIQRGERFFLRVWDLRASAARDFSGIDYYPVDRTWRITAQFTTFFQPLIIPVEDKIGTR